LRFRVLGLELYEYLKGCKILEHINFLLTNNIVHQHRVEQQRNKLKTSHNHKSKTIGELN
jgi:hypothetical protein